MKKRKKQTLAWAVKDKFGDIWIDSLERSEISIGTLYHWNTKYNNYAPFEIIQVRLTEVRGKKK